MEHTKANESRRVPPRKAIGIAEGADGERHLIRFPVLPPVAAVRPDGRQGLGALSHRSQQQEQDHDTREPTPWSAMRSHADPFWASVPLDIIRARRTARA